MNIMWLDAAATAFENIGWKFYLVFIVPGVFGASTIGFYWPDTKGFPLEEVAAVFGDAEEVAIYQRDLETDFHRPIGTSADENKKSAVTHLEATPTKPLHETTQAQGIESSKSVSE